MGIPMQEGEPVNAPTTNAKSERRISPMKWGECPHCGTTLDNYPPTMYIDKKSDQLVAIVCDICDEFLFKSPESKYNWKLELV